MTFEDLGKRLAQLGQDTKVSMQKMSEMYQLNSKMTEAKKTLNQVFAQVGEKVFEKFENEPLEGFEEQFEAVKNAKGAITALEEQLQQLRGVAVCPQCGREAVKGERFCSACGAKLPEMKDPMEQMDEDFKAVGEEVGDALNEAADKARDFFGGFSDKAEAFVAGVSSKFAEAQDAMEKAMKEEGEAAEDAGEAAQDVTDAAKEAADSAKECCCEAADEAKEACEEAADKVAEAAKAVDESAEEASGTGADPAPGNENEPKAEA